VTKAPKKGVNKLLKKIGGRFQQDPLAAMFTDILFIEKIIIFFVHSNKK
jgi:hypothetical protein